MTEREQRREQPAKAMREGPQPSRYMSEGRLTIVVVALAILTFLGILSETSLNIAYSTLMGECFLPVYCLPAYLLQDPLSAKAYAH